MYISSIRIFNIFQDNNQLLQLLQSATHWQERVQEDYARSGAESGEHVKDLYVGCGQGITRD